MTDPSQIYILRTSSDVLNKFSINNNSLIHEEIKDGDLINQNEILGNVKNYSAAIDNEDKIHIIYTNDNFNLNYLLLPQRNNIINVVLGKQNVPLDSISIIILDTNPHIFYAYADVKHNRHIIYHSFFIEGYWQSKEIFQAVGPRYIQPFLLELLNKDIYILLYLNQPKWKLGLFKLENSNGQWVDIDRNIELEDGCNVSLFISPTNMIIISYNKLINRNLQSMIIYKDLTVKPFDAWRSVVLSDKDTNTLKPSIFFSKEQYYMTWVQESQVVLKRSKDLITWEEVLLFDKYSNDYLKCFYMSNSSKDSDLKINGMCFSNTINLNTKINTDYSNEIPKVILPFESVQSFVPPLEAKAPPLRKDLEEKPNVINPMKNTISHLNSIIRQYEGQITGFKNLQISSLQDINLLRNNFLDKILFSKRQNDAFLVSYNNRLLQLFEIIQEKDELINDLLKKMDK